MLTTAGFRFPSFLVFSANHAAQTTHKVIQSMVLDRFNGREIFSINTKVLAILRVLPSKRSSQIRRSSEDFIQCLLWLDGAVTVDPAASEEAVTHHAQAKQKKTDCQSDYKQEPYNSKPARLWFCGARRVRISCHQCCVSSQSNACHKAPFCDPSFPAAAFKLQLSSNAALILCQKKGGVCTILNTHILNSEEYPW